VNEVVLPHIHAHMVDGRPVVDVDDAEVFDFVEDELIERFDLEYEYLQHVEGSGKTRMVYGPGTSLQSVIDALCSIDPAELDRVYRLNNPIQAHSAPGKLDRSIVKAGTFWYGDAIGRVLIERSGMRWGTGDPDDEPLVRDDAAAETYYVCFEGTDGCMGSSRGGPCSTLAEAITLAEAAPGIGETVVWLR
jgi:hypothetical protein